LVLLDTCASIWLLEQQPMSETSLAAIRVAAGMARVMVSPVSAWEIGLWAQRARGALAFRPSPQDWFADLLALPGMRLAPLVPGRRSPPPPCRGRFTETRPIAS
jgi:PIN domain nuclease of toxin-antitoxin system